MTAWWWCQGQREAEKHGHFIRSPALGPKTLNIVTLEDPIEYRIDGLNQVQVNRRMSFADALQVSSTSRPRRDSGR